MYRYTVLAALVVVYLLSNIDRHIMSILAVPIQKELHLSDTQLGLMSGTAFALFYSLLGVPIARLADVVSRTKIITTALVLWSGFTAVCGLATGFWQMFFARLGVGIGEAGGTAPSFSIISDYFPRGQRARALAIFTLAVPLGSAAGLFIGGYVAAQYGWRTAFVAVGLLGVLASPLFMLVVREPKRGRLDDTPETPVKAASDAPDASVANVRLIDVLRFLRHHPAFWFVSFGAAVAGMQTYGLAFWLPSFLMRSHGFTLADAANFMSMATLIGGTAGMLFGGWLGDHLGQRDAAYYAWVPAAAFLIALPFLMAAMYVSGNTVIFMLIMVPLGMGFVWTGPAIAIVQNLAPAAMRTTASAIFLLILNLIGLGLGSLIFGTISDLLVQRFGDDALRYAIILCCMVIYPLAALLFIFAGRHSGRRSTIDRQPKSQESALVR